MTKYVEGDETSTEALVHRLNSDTSWLRHSGRAGELDRRLLQGATAEELAEVRVCWKAHVAHLRKEHRLSVTETPTGFWRITGARTVDLANSPSVDAEDDLMFDEDYGDGGAVAADELRQIGGKSVSLRLHKTAQALAALAEKGLLAEDLLKASVCMLIRQASESNHWHNCAHYRSKQAAERIREGLKTDQSIVSSAAKYQTFCRSNLRHEHVVPNAVVYKMLKALKNPTVDQIRAVLEKYCIRATITLDEDQKLNKAGLASAMPEGFDYEALLSDASNPLARYIKVKLDGQLVLRTPGKLWYEIAFVT